MTMYLTRMELDVGKRDTRKALLSPSMFHGAIESSFVGERERRILALRFYEGKTQMEVSTEVGISQAQVSRLEKNALNAIRRQL